MTSWIDDVVADQTIESAWGNLIRDRTVTPFADSAERNTAIPSPDAGMTTFQEDTGYFEVYDASRTGWVPLNPRPTFLTYGAVATFGSGFALAGGDTTMGTLNVDYTMRVIAMGPYFAQVADAKCTIRFRDEAAATIQDFALQNPSPSLAAGRTSHAFMVSKDYSAGASCGVELLVNSTDTGQIQVNGVMRVDLIPQ